MSIIRLVAAFLATAVTLAVLGTVLQTSFVLGMLGAVGADIGAGPALSMILYDIAGLGPLYGAIMGLGLLVAFLAAALVSRLAGGFRALVFTVAGAVCVATALTLVEQVFFSIQMIAGARTLAGFLAQAAAGAAAGYLFAALTPGPRPKG